MNKTHGECREVFFQNCEVYHNLDSKISFSRVFFEESHFLNGRSFESLLSCSQCLLHLIQKYQMH